MQEYEPSLSDLNTVGTMIVGSRFGGSILGSALYGIQFFMVVSGLLAFFKRSKEARRGHIHYVILSCVILAAFFVDLVLDIWEIFRVLFTGGPEPHSYPYYALYMDNVEHGAFEVAGDAMLGVSVAVANVLLKWIVLLPCLTCLGAIVCHMIYLIYLRDDDAILFMAKAQIASVSLSVAMNVMVTALILLRLTMTRLETSKAFPNRKTSRMYSDAGGILVEAAVPLSVFGICFITASCIAQNWRSSTEKIVGQQRVTAITIAFAWLYYSFCALNTRHCLHK
ncbi:hypothetical protein BKA70DRAFT_1432704 [Coprinopsis sp. MPI-PUGE-AT-0042]|nr:hypothetical protein BKA70DRAFT_1432704 [Coprinopsis sp. MPI-PUGE-AT-0042]